MARNYKKGLIYTKDGCVGCNQCISTCPVDGANIARNQDGNTKVNVDPSTCIACGRCISACTHNNRTYKDDTDAFFEALSEGRKVSVLLDDTFYYTYPGEKASAVIDMLRRAGVAHVYDVSFGADINLWISAHYLFDSCNKKEDGGYISSVCASVILYLECYKPKLVKKLIPAAPPAFCTAIYAREYLNDDSEFAVFGNCTAIGHLASLPENRPVNINFNVTMARFNAYIGDEALTDGRSVSELRGRNVFPGYIFRGEFKKECEKLLAPDKYITQKSFCKEDIRYLKSQSSLFDEDSYKPVAVDILSSEYGCLTCPGKVDTVGDIESACANFYHYSVNNRSHSEDTMVDNEARLNYLDGLFVDIDPVKFIMPKVLHYDQTNIVPYNVIDEVLAALHKHSKQDKQHNCRACGYSGCVEMAKAIANGFNVRENCVAFAKGEIIRLASTDTLTGAPNMDSFSDRAAAILNTCHDIRFVLGWTDVKNLRIINDVLGYESGNDVLRAVAKTISDAIPDNGCYGRFADDSFVYMIPARQGIYDRIKRYAGEKCNEYKNTIPISVDLGFYEIEEKMIYTVKDISRFTDNARIAFDSVKGGYDIGIGIYTKQMKQTMIRESELTGYMAASLERGDFKVFFQPQYDHTKGVMVGAEALVRWIMGDRGIVSPAQFIPLFEKNGFIAKLDAFVWEQTCRYLRMWMNEGRQIIPVSVNISRVDIYSEDIVMFLKEITEKYNIDRKYLRLEITESAYIKDPDRMQILIGDLHELGFLVEMDDFGSGYSSLNVLKDMDVDILKLDLKFLTGGNEERGGSIIQSVIRMAGLLNIPVIAEGVEMREQADFMTSVGCNIIQGFYYAKPMADNDFVRLMGETIPEIEKKKGAESGKTNFYYRSDSLSKFLSPGSEVTSIFELAIGASALLEYCDDKLELIRANALFIKESGLTPELIRKHKNDIFDFVYNPDKNTIADKIAQIIECDETLTFTSLWGMTGSICLRTTAKLIAVAKERYVIFATIDNVTDLVDTERLRKSVHDRSFADIKKYRN